MVDHLTILEQNNPEDKIHYFDVTKKGYQTIYYIAGIDYTLRDAGIIVASERSNNLKTREIYFELHNLFNETIATIVFKKDVSFEKNSLIWTSEDTEFPGMRLNYERNAAGDHFYLTDEKCVILALKFNATSIDNEIVDDFQRHLFNLV